MADNIDLLLSLLPLLSVLGSLLTGFIVTGSSPDFSNFLQKHAVHRWATRF
jgi:hypothetical protein